MKKQNKLQLPQTGTKTVLKKFKNEHKIGKTVSILNQKNLPITLSNVYMLWRPFIYLYPWYNLLLKRDGDFQLTRFFFFIWGKGAYVTGDWRHMTFYKWHKKNSKLNCVDATILIQGI